MTTAVDTIEETRSKIVVLEAEKAGLTERRSRIAQMIAKLRPKADSLDLAAASELAGGRELDAEAAARVSAIDAEIAELRTVLDQVQAIADFEAACDRVRELDARVEECAQAARSALLRAQKALGALRETERTASLAQDAVRARAAQLQPLGVPHPDTLRLLGDHGSAVWGDHGLREAAHALSPSPLSRHAWS